jgi:hypothetical protein
MDMETFQTYLNDHLAGSVAAIELLEHLREISQGTERERLFASIQSQVQEDQEVLKRLLQGVGGKESRLRKAAAWLTEKIGEAKLKLDDAGKGDLRLLEALETLELGILGKLALWRLLAVIADPVPEVRKLDLRRLEQRATEQHDRLEVERLSVARVAFGS